MIESIARQAVILKCNMGKSVITGNYEYYYGAGLLLKLTDRSFSEDIKPLELYEVLKTSFADYETTDDKLKYLISIMLDYEPVDEYDEQMKSLLLYGKNEQKLWSVTA